MTSNIPEHQRIHYITLLLNGGKLFWCCSTHYTLIQSNCAVLYFIEFHFAVKGKDSQPGK